MSASIRGVLNRLSTISNNYLQAPVLQNTCFMVEKRKIENEKLRSYNDLIQRPRFFSTPSMGHLSVQRRDTARGIGTQGTPVERGVIPSSIANVGDIAKDRQPSKPLTTPRAELFPFKYDFGAVLFGPGRESQFAPDAFIRQGFAKASGTARAYNA